MCYKIGLSYLLLTEIPFFHFAIDRKYFLCDKNASSEIQG